MDHTAVFAAPLITDSQTPAYTVDVLITPPAPSAPSTRPGSVAPSGAATPAVREPEPAQKTITVPEVTTLFLSTLFQSATDFLGVQPTGTVISCPTWFTSTQRDALKSSAAAAGIPVLQLLDETAAVLVGYRVGLTEERQERALLGKPEEGDKGDREDRDKTVVVVDLGETSLNVAVCKTGEGEYVKLAQGRETNLGGKTFDDLLCQHFAKEFTKKTKVALTIPCAESSSQADKRAEAKLRLAVEHTKRSLSASSGAATCAVESLKDGMDLSGSINRMRFDGLAAPVYRKVADKAKAVIAEAGLDISQIDEVSNHFWKVVTRLFTCSSGTSRRCFHFIPGSLLAPELGLPADDSGHLDPGPGRSHRRRMRSSGSSPLGTSGRAQGRGRSQVGRIPC